MPMARHGTAPDHRLATSCPQSTKTSDDRSLRRSRGRAAIVVAFGLTRVATAWLLRNGEIPPVSQLATEFAIGICRGHDRTAWCRRSTRCAICGSRSNGRSARTNEVDLEERGASQRFLRDVRHRVRHGRLRGRAGYDVTRHVHWPRPRHRAQRKILVADSSNAHIVDPWPQSHEGRDAPGLRASHPRTAARRSSRGSTLQFTDTKGHRGLPPPPRAQTSSPAPWRRAPRSTCSAHPRRSSTSVHDGEPNSTTDELAPRRQATTRVSPHGSAIGSA